VNPASGRFVDPAWLEAEKARTRHSSRSHRPPRSETARWLAHPPRWLLLLALVFAPWAYGSTRVWTVLALSLILFLLLVLWLAECLARRRRPHLSPWAVGAAGCLLVQGWWMTFNAHGQFQPDFGVVLPVPAWSRSAPGSVAGSFSLYAMILLTGLVGTFLFVGDLARHPVWRRRVWMTLLWSGVSIAVFGLVLKLGGRPALAWIWEKEKIDPANNFAGFRYRANAGAFLNLVLPLLIFQTWRSFRRHDKPALKALWASGLFLMVAAIQLNPSRASWCIAWGIGAVAVGVILWQSWRRGSIDFRSRIVLVQGLIAFLLAAALGAIVLLGGWETSWKRIARLGLDASHRSPVEVYRTMVPEAGWFGFGPGTFEAIFPAFQLTYDYGDEKATAEWTEGFWRHAHQDYYQTLIEWGYLGTILWAILFLGGLGRACRTLFQGRVDATGKKWLSAAILALAGVLLHACVDFPLQVASIQLYVAVLLGICWGWPEKEREEEGAIVPREHAARFARSNFGESSIGFPRKNLRPEFLERISITTAPPKPTWQALW
jgi:O-antigen ligase